MRIELFVCLLATAAYVYCEVCTTDGDCTLTNCSGDSGWHLICEHPNPTGGIATDGGFCTCALYNLTCVYADDCKTTDTQTILRCPEFDKLHCYDQKCICTRW